MSLVIRAQRSAYEFASDMWPSVRLIHTGLFGVTESIQSLVGSSPPQSEWSQSPPMIQVCAGTVSAKSLMRLMNSAFVRASRSFTDERLKPLLTKWVCESMKPGVDEPALGVDDLRAS